MLDKFLDFLISIYDKITFFTIIRRYQKGVWLRGGKLKRVVDPGIYFKIPILDEIDPHHVLTTAMPLEPQSLTTLDEKDIVVKGIIKYKITDISKFYTDVFDAIDAIGDVSMGIIRNVISKKSWKDCHEDDIENEITKKVRVEARKWGLEVEKVTLSDMGRIRTLRLLGFNNKPN